MPECRTIHRQHVIRPGDLLEPDFNLGGLGSVLFARQLDACLNLADRDGRKKQAGVIDRLQSRHPRDGLGLRSSETTFVSSKYTQRSS
jgi:hypothetical protein